MTSDSFSASSIIGNVADTIYFTKTIHTIITKPIRQYTNKIAISNVNTQCKIYADTVKSENFIARIGPYDTIVISTRQHEKIIFLYLRDSIFNSITGFYDYSVVGDTFAIEQNKSFKYSITENKISSKNKILKDYKGKELYSINIEDEDFLDANQFVVTPLKEADKYIDVKSSGQMTFIIKLKKFAGMSFDRLVEELENKNRRYLDVGIEIYDNVTGKRKTYPQKFTFKDYE